MNPATYLKLMVEARLEYELWIIRSGLKPAKTERKKYPTRTTWGTCACGATATHKSKECDPCFKVRRAEVDRIRNARYNAAGTRRSA